MKTHDLTHTHIFKHIHTRIVYHPAYSCLTTKSTNFLTYAVGTPTHTHTRTHYVTMLDTLGTTPTWLFLAWAALVFLCSPLLFIVGVCLPELPLLMVRRFCYMPFDAV